MSAASKSDFAREHGVTPTTVTRWVKRGLAVETDQGRIERELSNRKLAGRPIVYRGGRLGGTPRGGPWATQRSEEEWELELLRQAVRRLRDDGLKLASMDQLVEAANEVLDEWR
jgi:hypothetical protein